LREITNDASVHDLFKSALIGSGGATMRSITSGPWARCTVDIASRLHGTSKQFLSIAQRAMRDIDHFLGCSLLNDRNCLRKETGQRRESTAEAKFTHTPMPPSALGNGFGQASSICWAVPLTFSHPIVGI
jgi:hypothetical protein